MNGKRIKNVSISKRMFSKEITERLNTVVRKRQMWKEFMCESVH